MITLYNYGPYFGVPDPSPFVMKAEMLLKLSGLDYTTNTRGLAAAPKGKLPYINDNGTIVADSTLIRLHLEQKHSIYFDRGLSTRDRGVAWSVDKMLEDHLYWVLVYWRWLKDANFERGPKAFFKRAPALIRPLVIPLVRRRIRQHLHSQGIGRHTDAEMSEMAARCIDALSQILGDSHYLLGDEPCGADATAFAFIAATLTPVFDSPVRDKMQSVENLVAYRDRMMAEFYPNFGRA